MLVNFEHLPIKSKYLAEALDMNIYVCYRALGELEMFNIIERTEEGIDFSFSARNRRPVGILIRTPEHFDDMACAYREQDEEKEA